MSVPRVSAAEVRDHIHKRPNKPSQKWAEAGAQGICAGSA